MRRNVLVFAGAPYPAMEICDCLKFNMLFHPIAASSYSNHSEFVFDECVDDLPFVFSDDFLDKFVKVIIDKKIEFVIPTDDTIALVLTENQERIPAKIVCSPYETAKICRYKSLTYKALNSFDFVPRTYSAADISNIVEYPVFVKPDNGQGSRGTEKINSVDEFSQVSDLEDKVICEYLPGEEYTVDCFTDRFGRPLFCGPRSRSRLMNGITARGFNVQCSKEFSEIIEAINARVKFRGYWFAQLKRDKNGTLKLMELCTRFAGTFGVSKSLGVNLPLMALCDFADLDTSAIVNDYDVVSDKTYIDRYKLSYEYTRVYVDYDDTITCNGGEKVNPYVMAFLYQCRNKGRRIVLISRHVCDHCNSLEEDMHEHEIPENLFSEILELQWNQKKSDFMDNSEPSIYLDNSFAERKNVHEALGMPVFDVANIDCLFDWR